MLGAHYATDTRHCHLRVLVINRRINKRNECIRLIPVQYPPNASLLRLFPQLHPHAAVESLPQTVPNQWLTQSDDQEYENEGGLHNVHDFYVLFRLQVMYLYAVGNEEEGHC